MIDVGLATALGAHGHVYVSNLLTRRGLFRIGGLAVQFTLSCPIDGITYTAYR